MKALTLEDALEVLTSRTGSKHALRCIEALVEDRSPVSEDKRALLRLHRQVAGQAQGALVAACLRAYADDGLTAVYEWAQDNAPALYLPVSLGLRPQRTRS